MLVKIKNLTGHVFNLDVEPTDTILHIKQLVEQKEGIPPEQQRIIFAAKQLFVFTPLSRSCVCVCVVVSLERGNNREDSKTVEQSNVTAGATLHLVLALRG